MQSRLQRKKHHHRLVSLQAEESFSFPQCLLDRRAISKSFDNMTTISSTARSPHFGDDYHYQSHFTSL